MTEATKTPVLAIDIGGTKVAVAVVVGGQIVARRQIATPRTGRGADIVAAVVREASDLPAATLVGVATTGLVDGKHLTALNPQTLPIENHFPLGDELARELAMPVVVINDAQAAAWAEYKLGAGSGVDRMLFVTVSTGIGAGLVLGGTLQVGSHGLAGHLGHVVVDPSSDEMCGCGRRGCIERMASGTAIARMASRELGKTVAAPDVFALAAAGDGAAEAIIDRAAKLIGTALTNAVAALDIDRIVIGGGVGLAEGFVTRISKAIEDEPARYHRPIERASLGSDAGLIGAALIANSGNFHQP